MSVERFEQLKAALRFDDPARRDRDDKLSPVRAIVDRFNQVMRDIYKPNEFLTIDEMLVEFHGRVTFRQYIPTKPGKFGVKLYWITEATAILLQVLVYTGQSTLTDEEKREHGGHVPAIVMKLTAPYLDKGRNLTGDNFFSDLSTAEKLLERNTTYVGTLRANKRCIPPVAKSIQGRTRGDSKHLYHGNATICSFWDKATKPVNVLSTMHGHQEDLLEGKPEIIGFYNQTKSGVDTLDKLVRTYSSKRKYRRWPVHIFFTLVDCAAYVGYRMFREQNGNEDETHYHFKKNLAYELCMPFVQTRSELPGLQKTVKETMQRVGVVEPAVRPTQPRVGQHTQGRCTHCPREKDRKSKTVCARCGSFVCREHHVVLCPNCAG